MYRVSEIGKFWKGNGTNSAQVFPFLVQQLFANYNMTSRTERFQRKPKDKEEEEEVPHEPEEVIRFPPEKEAVCRTQACCCNHG